MPKAEMQKWYDTAMLRPSNSLYYGNSDYYNFGYWTWETRNQAEASEALVERLLSFLPEKRGNILDVACGLGATTRHLLRYYRPEDVVAINISEVQLARTRENAPGVDARLMDAVALEFPDASFDSVICVEAAFHFETRERFLREAVRVLKPGGRLVISDILYSLGAAKVPRLNMTPANYVPSPDAYEKLLIESGFSTADVQDVERECWYGFRDHLVAWPATARRARQMSLREYLMARLSTPLILARWNSIVQGYVLASAQKAD